MKKISLLILVLTMVFSCKKEESTLPSSTYQVNVTAKGVYNGIRAHLKSQNDGRNQAITDTAMVMNESFKFEGEINGTAIRILTINGVNGQATFVLEPGVTNIEIFKDSIYKSKIAGGYNNDVFNLYKSNYNAKLESIKNTRAEIRSARQQNDTSLLKELGLKNTQLNDELNNFAYTFIDEHPDSDFSLLLLEGMAADKNANISKVKSSLQRLEGVANKNNSNLVISKKIELAIKQKESVANTDIGKVAPNFSAPDPNGKEIALNDIKGKVTIIDFWASWCKPCRRENPNVVKLYEKYHDKGLEIISVSLDKEGQKNRWIKAIEDDNLTWHNISNLKFWSDPIAKMYNVRSIPATFILDESGTIVAKKLRGAALEKKVEELLK
ncbi:redoxin domain-containing protein [Pontimicrobium sp. IMCC45349]|uniref:redoxin domain-containing protein n=1 Tax=Pontimicrobium sp. IMCC45349 TaxID=3391574 RepID=UPI0039A154F3